MYNNIPMSKKHNPKPIDTSYIQLRIKYFSVLLVVASIMGIAMFIGWQRGMANSRSKVKSMWSKEVWFNDTSVTMQAPMKREHDMTQAYMLKLTDPSNIVTP